MPLEHSQLVIAVVGFVVYLLWRGSRATRREQLAVFSVFNLLGFMAYRVVQLQAAVAGLGACR